MGDSGPSAAAVNLEKQKTAIVRYFQEFLRKKCGPAETSVYGKGSVPSLVDSEGKVNNVVNDLIN